MASYIVADRKQAQGVYPATRVRSSKGLVGELVGPSGRFSNFSSFWIGFEPLLPPSVGQIRPYLSESLLGTVAARPYRVGGVLN